jgi:hypothetical protein
MLGESCLLVRIPQISAALFRVSTAAFNAAIKLTPLRDKTNAAFNRRRTLLKCSFASRVFFYVLNWPVGSTNST